MLDRRIFLRFDLPVFDVPIMIIIIHKIRRIKVFEFAISPSYSPPYCESSVVFKRFR